MKASYLGAMGYAQRYNFPTTWPIPPSYHDPETSVRSYQEGIEECQLAEDVGFDWISFSEHHYSGRIATGTPAVMAATLAFAGRNPVTGKDVMDAAKVPGVLAVMATAGLYDDSGKWL